MIQCNTFENLLQVIDNERKNGRSIGFIPTMGALHQGHLLLIQLAHREERVSVVSIFVNPLQFNNAEDFQKYPNTLVADIQELEKIDTQILFVPSVEEMYPIGMETPGIPDFGELIHVLEGEFRPGHFEGVAKVLRRFLEKMNPDYLYLGQKDYQQVLVISKLIELMQYKTEVKVVETVREPDGLALSSRNKRLNEEEREAALVIWRVLQFMNENKLDYSVSELEKEGLNQLRVEPLARPEYVAICDRKDLKRTTELIPGECVALIACWIGEVRLIDNILL